MILQMANIANTLLRIKQSLIVSCQAAPGDPLDDTDVIRRIALAAIGGGTAGLRLNSAEHIAAIRRDTSLPIIGIKKHYANGQLRITPDFAAAAELAAAGADIIALDCTHREWTIGEPWPLIVQRIHQELKLPVMADVSTLEEALAAAAAGVDVIGPTLNGYTEETKRAPGFNWPLLRDMVQKTGCPIIAEGQIGTPEEAKRALQIGAWSVVVGSAITRPGVITAQYARAVAGQTSAARAIGADIGGTSVKAGWVDRDGTVDRVNSVSTNAAQGRDAIAAATATVIERALADGRSAGWEPAGLGIASAGAIDVRNGTVFAATENLPGWAGFDLRCFAEDRFHLPVYVANDAQAAVLAELRFGLGRELSDFVAVTLGTGIGGGIVSGGKLITGQHGFAGTLGHQIIRMDGVTCNCGRRGCLEAYVSTAALIREYQVITGSAIQAIEISQLAIAGDRAALEAYRVLARYLAEGIANLFNILDPQAVILSGGLIEEQITFVTEVETMVREFLHFGSKRQPRVLHSAAGKYAGLQGAASSVFYA
jgi:predicted NBD/HSP70 family sugar kinase/putative N-acetylmannosamine-6-phosphate epimerase